MKIFGKKPQQIPFTPAGYENLLSEKSSLTAARPDTVESLRKAREMGDLSENGYYKAARARLSFLDSRLRRLDRLLRSAVVIKQQQSEFVDIGSTVTVSDQRQKYTYKIVGGYESDPSKQTISHLSPIGKALIGKKTGDQIFVRTPAGEKHFTLTDVS